jgi:hypothetical protein
MPTTKSIQSKQLAPTVIAFAPGRVGGGFGGATVWLVEKDKTQKILMLVSEAYRQKTGAICTALITKASRGAHNL